jgi:hypothetical protein
MESSDVRVVLAPIAPTLCGHRRRLPAAGALSQESCGVATCVVSAEAVGIVSGIAFDAPPRGLSLQPDAIAISRNVMMQRDG